MPPKKKTKTDKTPARYKAGGSGQATFPTKQQCLAALKEIVDIMNMSSVNDNAAYVRDILAALRGPDTVGNRILKAESTGRIRYLMGLRCGAGIGLTSTKPDYFASVVGLQYDGYTQMNQFLTKAVEEAKKNDSNSYDSKGQTATASAHFFSHINVAVYALNELGFLTKPENHAQKTTNKPTTTSRRSK